MKQQIVLIGLPGAGKTTVGALVAEKLGCPFVDIDAVIVRRMQMPVSRIFAELGETRFREVERETVNDALAAAPSVIVPGWRLGRAGRQPRAGAGERLRGLPQVSGDHGGRSASRVTRGR